MTPQEAGRLIHEAALAELYREPGIGYPEALRRVLLRPGMGRIVAIYQQPFARPRRRPKSPGE